MSRPSLRRLPRRLAAAAWLALSALALGSCTTSTIPGAATGLQAPGAQAPATEAPTQVAPVSPEAVPPSAPTGSFVRIGILLPLSGPSGALGKGMLDAAQMAMFEVADDHLQILPRDTQGQPQAAAAAAQDVIQQGAKLIIGPLLAAEVAAVKPVAQAAGVPVLAFSTQASLAGDGTYLMGFLPQQEIERVVAFAHARGRNRFGALAPRSPYGEVAVNALQAAVAAGGASLGPVEYYDPSAGDLTPVVRRFATTVGDTDALLLPEGGNRLRALAPLLPYYDVDPDKVKFLGTGLWDESGLGTEPALDGGWYAAPAPAARAEFEKRYTQLYHHAPPRLATLAYDATALAAVLSRNAAGPSFSPDALTNPSGFAGIDGIFRLRPDGLVQRGLAVLEVRRGGPAVLDPAPTTFQQLGF